MQNYIVDRSGCRWNVRRTCTDTPGRAYAAQRQCGHESDILPGIVGFYAESLSDIRHKLGVAA
jgi:hypothetical protein